MADRAERADPKLPDHTTLPAEPDHAFDRIADLVRKVLGVPVALVSLVDKTRQVFPGAVGLPNPWSQTRTTPLTHSFCQHVVITAGPLVVADARVDPLLATNLAISDLGVIAYAGMPLVDAAGVVVGSLCAIDGEPRAWTPSELELLADLAAACSAELQVRELATRASAAYDRTRVLMELATALSATATIKEICGAVAHVTHDQLGADFAGITTLDVHGQELAYPDAVVLPGALGAAASRIDLEGDSPSAAVARSGQPIFFESAANLAASSPTAAEAARASGGEAFAYLPLRVGNLLLGTLAILWRQSRGFDMDDRDIMSSLAGYTAQAVYRAQLLEERRSVARTLQEALVRVLPTVAGFELAGRYLPASATDQVGGDWYDAFPTRPGSLTVTVGDVVGHDTGAAAAMGQLTASLRALIVDRPQPPAEVLGRLDRVMTIVGHERLATAVVAELTTSARGVELSWSSAGHPPILVLSPGLAPSYLEQGTDVLLGLDEATGRTTSLQLLPFGTVLLLYTDGLIERRDSDLDAGQERLAKSAARHRHLVLDALVDAVLADLLPDGHDDDAALFAIRVAGKHV